MSSLVDSLDRLVRYLSQDFLGGPRHLSLAQVINFQKGLTLPFVLGLMLYYENWNIYAWVYMALHGSYGLLWLLKHYTFRDKRWDIKITYGGALLSFLIVLGPYWLFPWILISQVLGPDHQPSHLIMFIAIFVHTIGVALMLVTDAQKYYTLRFQPQLITDGMFKYIRHSNYLGEMLIYACYALLVQHWVPWVILIYIWIAVFFVNMLMIERSISRYPQWDAYKQRTGMLLPKVLR